MACVMRNGDRRGRRVAMIVGLLLAAGVAGACSSRNVRGNMLELVPDTANRMQTPLVFGTNPVTVGDIQYQGHNGGLKSRWPPVMTQVSVTIKNVGQHPMRLALLGGNCAVRVRIYSAEQIAHSAGHASTVPPVFDATQPGYECYVPELRPGLVAGADTTLQSAGDGPGIRLPPGRYELVGVVTVIPSSADSLRRHGPLLVQVPAGSIRVPPPYD